MPAAPRLLRLLLILGALVLLVAGCGSDDGGGDGDSSSDQARDASTSTTTTAEDEPAEPTGVPEPVPEGELPPIVVTSPQPLGYVSGAFVLTGSAQVTEGALRWAILDAKLKPMATGAFDASCGAPCRGTFRTRVPLRDVAIGSWELHVWTPPVADDDPQRVHDTMVPITVTAEPVQGTPPPGAEPPGGVPNAPSPG